MCASTSISSWRSVGSILFSLPSVTQLRVSRCTSMPATRLACQRAVLSHVQAAVDSPDLPCDVGGLVSGEEHDGRGDFCRPAEPTNRDLSTEPFHQDWREAAALAAYHAESGHVRLLICDDARQCKLVADELALCWIHDGRHS